MNQVLYKSLGPIGRPRYRWIDGTGHHCHMFAEVRESCLSLGFKIICEYGHDDFGIPHEFIVEAKNEEADALFLLTWSQHINTDSYHHDKNRKLPADWITKVLYYTIKAGEDRLGFVLPVLCAVMISPILLDHFYKIPQLLYVTLAGYSAMMFLVFLRIYDDHRLSKHERKLRKLDNMPGANDY
jgi:hypothetical protein